MSTFPSLHWRDLPRAAGGGMGRGMSEPLAEENWKRTFGLDLLRSVPLGVVETVGTTFAMFVAIALLKLGDLSKSAIIGAPALGLLLGFLGVALVRRAGWSVNVASALGWSVAAGGYAVVALFPGDGTIFVGGIVVALLAHMLAAPMQSQIYKRHYPDAVRGRLFSVVAMCRATASAVFGYGAGLWLLGRGGDYGALFWVFAGCSVVKAVVTLGMRPVYLRKTSRFSLFESFEHLRDDAAFRKLLVTWMLLGFGNLLCMALFVEFVTNPAYGFGYGAARVSLLTTTLPMSVFIVSVFAWGLIYDKMEFYRLRVLVNAFFFLGILVYYWAPNFTVLCVGMALHGVGKAGGNVLWSLWTTKFAPADKVSEYMGLHTMFTGVRGVISAYFAFVMASTLGPEVVAVVGAFFILVASLMLIPEIRANGRVKTHTTPS
ncbi:MAG: MFS transporter [Verrucomicrobiales bacterium]